MEISNRKETINKEILYELKTTSVDCAIYADGRSREKLLCYNFGSNNANNFLSLPSYKDEQTDDISQLNIKKIELQLEEINIRGKLYLIKRDSETSKTGVLLASIMYSYSFFDKLGVFFSILFTILLTKL